MVIRRNRTCVYCAITGNSRVMIHYANAYYHPKCFSAAYGPHRLKRMRAIRKRLAKSRKLRMDQGRMERMGEKDGPKPV